MNCMFYVDTGSTIGPYAPAPLQTTSPPVTLPPLMEPPAQAEPPPPQAAPLPRATPPSVASAARLDPTTQLI